MTPQQYSLQRLDAELYHELTHNIPITCPDTISNVCPPGVVCSPTWFSEGLGTWAQSAVTSPGIYTKVKAQMEDAMLYFSDAYTSTDPFGGYGKTTMFYWYLVDKYGIEGLNKMIRENFGYENIWITREDVDNKGFIPWTGKTALQLSQEFKTQISLGWRVNITNIMKKITMPNYQTNVNCPTAYYVCTYVLPNNINGIFYLNGTSHADSNRARINPGDVYQLQANIPSGYTFRSWSTIRSVYVANTSSPSTTVIFNTTGWDGTCVGGLTVQYDHI
jgi:hypothetical protein